MTIPSPMETRLRALHETYRALHDGEVATYIPELATVEPDRFAISVMTVDGHLYEVGDSRHRFTIQSVSKPFVFARALDDHGRDELLRRVGVEPTGDPFNAIVLDEAANRPPNPMVNAGAIAVSGLVRGDDPGHRWARIVGTLEAFAGRPLAIDDAVAASESATGHRNRAIAHLMRNFDMIRADVDEVLDLYFRQCAVTVDATDLACMAATLAAGGRNPRTGEQALDPTHVPAVLSVMSSCGMYDASGSWLYRVGMPAKSGVGGGIIAVLPGQLGIGVFSPRLDENGNSVRGVRVCEDLSRDLGMHLFADGARAGDAVRAVYDRGATASRRARPAEEAALLRRHGAEVLVVELQGRLVFGSVERLARRVADRLAGVHHLVVEVGRVTGSDVASAVLLAELLRTAAAAGLDVHVAGTVPAGPLAGALATAGGWALAVDLDRALERAEEATLARHGRADDAAATFELGDLEVCTGLDRDDLAALEACAPLRQFRAGEELCRPGEGGESAFLVLRGRILVTAGGSPGTDARLRVLGSGSMAGEMALLSGEPRSAWMFADGDVLCRELSSSGLDAFTRARPSGAVRLLRNVACLLGSWLREPDVDRSPVSGTERRDDNALREASEAA